MFPAEISWHSRNATLPVRTSIPCMCCAQSLYLTVPCIKHTLHAAINCIVHFQLPECCHTLCGFSAWALQEDLGVPAVRSRGKAQDSTSCWTDKSNIQRYQTNGGSTQTELTVWRERKAKINAHTSRSESWSCCRGTNHSDWFHIHLIYLCTFHTSLTKDSDSEQGAVSSTHLVDKAYPTSVIFEDMIAC